MEVVSIRRWISDVFIVIAVGIILYAGWSLYRGFSDYRESDRLYKEAREQYVHIKEPDSGMDLQNPGEKDSKDLSGKASEDSSGTAMDEEDKKQRDKLQKESQENSDPADDSTEADVSGAVNEDSYGSQSCGMEVDLQRLQAINPDIIGWIYVENTDISYPLLYSGDDTAYLRHAYDGSPLNAGSIFLRGANAPDLSDSLSVIYGHMTSNHTMFGGLTDFQDASYRASHSYFQIVLPGSRYRYRIDQCGLISATDSMYATCNDGSNQRRVVLSTCYGETQRFIVSGTLVESSSI